MRTGAVLAICAVMMASEATADQDGPFASLNGSFWRPADSSFPDGTVLRISSDTLSLSTACFYLRDFFKGSQGKPSFQFRADYATKNSSTCEKSTSAASAPDDLLSKTVAFRLKDGTLQLTDASESKTVTFKRITPDGFEFRWWAITGYRVGGKIERLMRPDGAKPQILFFNGSLLGSPGYGEFVGEYSLESDRLKTSAGLYEIGNCCDEAVEAQSDAILDILKMQLEFKADRADRFALYDQQGNVELELAEEK